MNNDGEGSDSDESYYAELERIKQQQAEEQKANNPVPALNAQNRRFVPKIAVKNLGFSTLMKEGQAKTQEELDVENCV